VLDPAIARAAVDPAPGEPGRADAYEQLTDREKQVLRLVADGRSNKEVASTLGIAVKTAMSHRENVMRKLGLHNRTELVRFAVARGVVRVDQE
jgi:DNA-binding NarL/FixJ family response regulator